MSQIARDFNISEGTVRKWVKKFKKIIIEDENVKYLFAIIIKLIFTQFNNKVTQIRHGRFPLMELDLFDIIVE